LGYRKDIESALFSIQSDSDFNELALEIFRFQHKSNPVYREYCDLLKVQPSEIKHFSSIPFLPIELFKNHEIICDGLDIQQEFTSSGTTGSIPSRHLVARTSLYEESFTKGFERFYGPVEEYRILALLPAYLERTGSSLVYMVDKLIAKSQDSESGFFLDNVDELKILLSQKTETKTLLVGVSFALLDLIEKAPLKLKNTIVMETGGMKGRKKEITRQELHGILKKGFGLDTIHSEYGMTELLSQAYAKTHGHFETPPWMRILTRDINDPLSPSRPGKTGGMNIIDLANLYSCSFIATGDLGRIFPDGSTEILGRFDFSDTRGCNLMVGDN
jgi:phenylacetate-coenzyme A ligase PaaK-like adenylate-forming protein